MSKAKVIKIGIYYGAGVVLVGYLAFNIFFNLTNVQVPGLVTAPIYVIRANVDGIVASVKIGPGDSVEPQSQAVDLANPEIERDYLTSRHKLSLAELEKQQAQDRQVEGRKELDHHLADLRLREKAMEESLERLQGSAEQFVAYEAEVGDLFRRKITTFSQFQKSLEGSSLVREKVDELESALLEVKTAVNWAEQGYFFAEGRLDRGYHDAKKNGEMAERVIQVEKEKIRRIEELRALLKLRSPETGKVLKVMVEEGNGVETGQTIALIEKDGTRIAEALVHRKQMSRIAVKKPARVYVPALGRAFGASVENIDYSPDPERIKQIGSFGWAGGVEAIAVVQLRLDDEKTLYSVPSGEPAMIQFSRRLGAF